LVNIVLNKKKNVTPKFSTSIIFGYHLNIFLKRYWKLIILFESES
jgi:hypothetical protein